MSIDIEPAIEGNSVMAWEVYSPVSLAEWVVVVAERTGFVVAQAFEGSHNRGSRADRVSHCDIGLDSMAALWQLLSGAPS